MLTSMLITQFLLTAIMSLMLLFLFCVLLHQFLAQRLSHRNTLLGAVGISSSLYILAFLQSNKFFLSPLHVYK
jgi:hypothetical protein